MGTQRKMLPTMQGAGAACAPPGHRRSRRGGCYDADDAVCGPACSLLPASLPATTCAPPPGSLRQGNTQPGTYSAVESTGTGPETGARQVKGKKVCGMVRWVRTNLQKIHTSNGRGCAGGRGAAGAAAALPGPAHYDAIWLRPRLGCAAGRTAALCVSPVKMLFHPHDDNRQLPPPHPQRRRPA